MNAIVQSGDTIYIGGAFSSVGGEARNRLAAIDASSGQVTAWNPDANGTVYALAIGGGGAIYAGGNFGLVGGQKRKGLVKLGSDGVVDPAWKPKTAQGAVRALGFSNGWLYLGGDFQSVAGSARRFLAAVDGISGALQSWDPSASGRVRALEVATDGSIFAGGDFATVGGTVRPFLAQLDGASGSVTPWDSLVTYPVFALSASGGSLYIGGGGVGGVVAAYSAANGNLMWSRLTNGDVQGIDASSTTVYAGGHFNFVTTGAGTATRRKFATFDASNGALSDYNPGANGPYGVGPVTVTDTALMIGGDFTVTGGVAQERFARFLGNP